MRKIKQNCLVIRLLSVDFSFETLYLKNIYIKLFKGKLGDYKEKSGSVLLYTWKQNIFMPCKLHVDNHVH